MHKLALRNILRHKLRTAMTLAVIVLGLVGMILSGGFVKDMLWQLGEALIHSQSGHLQVYKAEYFAKGGRSPEQYLIERPEVLQQSLAQLAQVDARCAPSQHEGQRQAEQQPDEIRFHGVGRLQGWGSMR